VCGAGPLEEDESNGKWADFHVFDVSSSSAHVMIFYPTAPSYIIRR
jgi:hypothetical protein